VTVYGNIASLAVAMVFIGWLVLVQNLFRTLENKHPAKYDELGRPSLFQNNNLKTNKRFLSFIFSNESRMLNDMSIHKRVVLLRFWFFACILSFFCILPFFGPR